MRRTRFVCLVLTHRMYERVISSSLYTHVTTPPLSTSSAQEIYVGSSSRRYKKDIEGVQAAEAARVWDLRPVSYRALEADPGAAKNYGFIAEEVADIDPRLVFWGKDEEGQQRVEGVNYDQVSGVGYACKHACVCMCVCGLAVRIVC